MSSDRLYGNWLRPQKVSIRGLPWPLAVAVVAAYLVGVIVAQSDPRRGALILGGSALATVAGTARIAGMTLAGWLGGKARWRWAAATGATGFQAVTSAGWVLPGPLAETVMLTVPHPSGDYGAIHQPRARRVAVTVRVASAAAELSEPGAHDAAVTAWERWLEHLGHRPEIAFVTVTVETSPTPGNTLRHTITHRLSPTAPADCRALMTTLTDTAPAAAMQVETRISLVFDLRAWDAQLARRDRRRGVQACLPLLDASVQHLTAGLAGCGLRVLGPMSPARLAGAVRAAFDPASAAGVEVALLLGRGDVPDWEHAGPAAAREHRDTYLHDSGVSASFVWAQAPRQLVTSRVLDPLMRPGTARKRVTVTYQPTPATHALDAATRQVRRRLLARMVAALPVIGRAATAQDDRDEAAADQATREVAAGAGWIAATLTATVTAPDQTALRAAVADLEQTAGASQVRLRRLYELQAAGFYAGLPAGLSLTDLAHRWTR